MDSFIRKAKDILGSRKTLPVLPASAERIIASTTDEFTDLTTLSHCIGEDPVISARIVGLSNSAFYAQQRPITSVEEAIIRVLGLDLTRGIAIGMAVSDVLGSSLATGFDGERFWRSSLSKSALLSSIAKNSATLSDQVPLCSLTGLLANIGLLAAVAIVPDETQVAIETSDECLRAEMRLSLGCDYTHLAAALAELWSLPGEVQATFLARCSDDWVQEECTPLQACLFLADTIKGNDLEAIVALPNTARIVEMLGVSNALDSVILSQEKAEGGIAELARVLTTSGKSS
ncbi:MAG: HDOD domain-containing protein [Pseudomonadales bacterium]